MGAFAKLSFQIAEIGLEPRMAEPGISCVAKCTAYHIGYHPLHVAGDRVTVADEAPMPKSRPVIPMPCSLPTAEPPRATKLASSQKKERAGRGHLRSGRRSAWGLSAIAGLPAQDLHGLKRRGDLAAVTAAQTPGGLDAHLVDDAGVAPPPGRW